MIDHFKCSSDNLEVMVGVELDRNHCILLCLLFIFRDPRGFSLRGHKAAVGESSEF